MTRIIDIHQQKPNQNLLINGGFDFWQRGVSFTTDAYTADRWYFVKSGVASFVKSAGGNSAILTRDLTSGYCFIRQSIESSPFLSGKWVTFSCKVKSVSGGSKVDLIIAGHASKDATLSNLNNSPVLLGRITPTITSEFKTYSVNAFVPVYSNDTYTVAVLVRLADTETGDVAESIEVKEVKLEEGQVATSFTRAGEDRASELLKCQRFFQKSYSVDVTPGVNTFGCIYTSDWRVTGQGIGLIEKFFSFPVELRATPTITTYDIVGNINKVSYYESNAAIHNRNRTFASYVNGIYMYTDAVTSKGGFGFHFTADAEVY